MDIFLEKTVENIRLGKKPSGKILTRYKTQKHKLNTTKSEIEYMKSLGYRRVFDCGQLIYKYSMKDRSIVS